MTRGGPFQNLTFLVQRSQQKKFRLRNSTSSHPCILETDGVFK